MSVVHSRRTRRLPWCALFVLAACSRDAPPALTHGAEVIHYLLLPATLSRSAFSAGFPDGKPSQFVSYVFSDIGAAEWPTSEEWANDAERAEMKAAGIPMPPRGVEFVPLSPDPKKGMQLVVRHDDGRGMVIVEGYEDPAKSKRPVLVREWPLPKVQPAPGVEAAYQSNLQMGMRAQAF
jgi:hypothetical protein